LDGEKRVAPLELFFDLVFVFALTQVTARMADDLSWGGLLRGLLVLAAIWWAWAAYAWLTNEVDARRAGVRLAIFGAMVAMLLASLAIPGAFEGDALLFACAYLGVRVMHIAVFAAASDDVDVRQAARALAPSATAAPALLLAAAALDGAAQTAVWIAALAFDYVLGGIRGIGGFRLSPGHFAERHGLILIIALGESIVAIGVGAAGLELGPGELAAAALGVVLAAALWWVYFDATLDAVEGRLHRLPAGRPRNVMARDSFSYLHLPLVAGIVLLALGVKKTLEHVDEPLKDVAAVALCGGVALYLVADVAFRRRCLATLDRQRLVAAGACVALLPVALELPALAALAAVAAVCAALVAYEALAQSSSRASPAA
jgi:low temperature requirement protein LtrA